MLEAETLEVLTEDIEFCIRNLKPPECTLRYAGRFYYDLCQKYRARGITRLLLSADSGGFHHDLFESGRVWQEFLSRCAQEKYSDFYFVCSRSEPFFDALAAGALGLAIALAELSPGTVRAGDEYEEDFCYARFFHHLILGKGSAELGTILEQFELALEGSPSPRFKLCEALKQRSRDGFDTAFCELLEERKAETRKERGPRTVTIEANQSVFIEGLGVLQVAHQAGLATQREYDFCPALARHPTIQASHPGPLSKGAQGPIISLPRSS